MENKSQYNLARMQSNLQNKNIYLDSFPVQVHFLMIDKCNVKCIMCGGDYFKSKSGRMITLEKFKTMAANLKLENVRAIVLAGAGDPLLNKDLIPIIRFVRSAYPHITISVTTNGLALSETPAGLLLEQNTESVNISINSATRETYKRIMQVDGFDAVCKNAKKFVDLKKRSGKAVTFQFSAAINRLNIEELPRLVELGKEIGIDSINLFYTRFYPERIRHMNVDDPTDRLENKDSLFFHQKLSDDMVEKAATLARQYGIRFSHEPLFRQNAPPCACTWTFTQLMVGFDGEIYPCGGSEVHFREKVEKGVYNFGNALQGPVDGFWNNEQYRALRISSQQGETCLILECKCCANVVSANDLRSHIMQWDETERVAPLDSTQNIVNAGPLVSVIVPTYNRHEELTLALKSILAQTYKNIEIIVVNDCGNDVEKIVSSLSKDGNITYIKHAKNRGLAAARNTGIRASRGKYIAYLDDDDLFYPHHVATLVKFLESGDHKVAYTDAYRAHQIKENGKYVVKMRDVPYSFDFDYNRILITNFIPVLCFMHDRSCVDEAGFFDESLKRLEDWDMWIRMSRKYQFAHIKELTCEFSWRTDGSTMTSGQMQEFVEARNIISKKYGVTLPSGISLPKFRENQVKSLVSIIILTFNQLKYTKECVESIMQHTPEPHELIFVDNASTDGTVAWLKKLIKDHPNYKLIENKKNLGFPKGCNQGIEASSGEYIMLLNNDVVVTKEWLSGMLETLNSAPDIGIVGPMTNNIDGQQKVPQPDYTAISGLGAYAGQFRERNRHRRVPKWRIIGFCMLFKRALAERVGALDERFGTGCFEDDDLCSRAVLGGFRNVIAGDVFIHHYGSRSFVGNSIDAGAAWRANSKIFSGIWDVTVQTEFGQELAVAKAIAQATNVNHKGHVNKAIQFLSDVVKYAPEDKTIYWKMAEILIEAGLFKEALEAINIMGPGARAEVKSLELIGYCKKSLEFPAEANEYAEQALALDPASAPALNLKGELAYQQGDKTAAKDFFTRAIAADPSYGEPYTNLGVMKWATNEQEDGLRLLEQGFILSPTTPDCASHYHTAVTTLGRLDQAVRAFNEAKGLYPGHKRISFLLTDLLIKQERFSDAMREIEKAFTEFGVDDGLLAAALAVRNKLGPLVIEEKSGAKSSLSVCMIVKNEEKNIVKSLSSVKPLADELIVVDTGSTDRTKDLAQAFGAKVYDFAWTDSFAEARNYALTKASGDWIFTLDADEVISLRDHARFKALIAEKSARPVAYAITTRNYVDFTGLHGWEKNDNVYDEQAGSGWVPSKKVRLFTRHTEISFINPVHESLEPALEKLGIEVKDCPIPIHHYGKLDKEKSKIKGAQYLELDKKKLQEKGGSDPKTLWELGIQEFVNNNYQNSLEWFRALLDLDPRLLVVDPALPKVHLQIGICHMCLHRHADALTALEKATTLDPNLKEAWLNYAMTLFCLGRAPEALKPIDTFLSLDPDFLTGKVLRALTEFCSEKKDKGLQTMRSIRESKAETDQLIMHFIKELRLLGNTQYLAAILGPLKENYSLTPELEELLKECAGVKSVSREFVPGLTSIVILTYNELRYTKECIESIQKHTPEPHELIFVDNGSTDETVKWLRQLVKQNPHYRLIENKTNLGFAKGSNQGLEASCGEYLMLLNNDVVVTEGWLSGMLEGLLSAPDIGIVGPMTNHISGIQKVNNIAYESTDALPAYAAKFRNVYRHRRVPTRRIVGFCMLFKRDLVEKIGLLDERFGSGNFEDDDYCFRAALEGRQNLIAGDVFIYHYGSRSFAGNKIDYGAAITANKKLFAEKWCTIDTHGPLMSRIIAVTAREKADELRLRGETENAIAKYAEGIGNAPEDKTMYFALTELLLEEKRFQDALAALREMPEAGADARKLELTGYCNEGLGRDDEAEACADQALHVHEASATAWNLKGVLAYKRGDRKQAGIFFRKALAIDPGYGEAVTNIGVLMWAAGQKDEGSVFLEKGFILAPTNQDAASSYYAAVAEKNDFARAETLLRDARDLYPRSKRIVFLLIDAIIQQEKKEDALREIEDAMAIFGVDDDILAAALELRNTIGPKEIDRTKKEQNSLSLCMIVKNEEANLSKCLVGVRPLVDELIVVDTGSNDRTKELARAFGAKVYAFAWEDDFAEARNESLAKASGDWILILDTDEAISPKDHASLRALLMKGARRTTAYAFETRNYVVDASVEGWVPNDNCYGAEETGTGWYPSKKTRLFPKQSNIRFANAVHEGVEASLKKAGITVKECVVPVHHYGKLDKEKADAKGLAYYLLGKKKLEEQTGDPKAIRELAVQAGELKRYEEAVDLWKKLIALNPKEALAYFNMGYAYLMLQKFDEAHAASKRAVELDPAMKEARVNLATCELAVGDREKAVLELETVHAECPEYVPAVAALAAAHCMDEDKEQRLAYFLKMRAMGYNFSGYISELSRLLIAAGRNRHAAQLLEAGIESGYATGEIMDLKAACV